MVIVVLVWVLTMCRCCHVVAVDVVFVLRFKNILNGRFTVLELNKIEAVLQKPCAVLGNRAIIEQV